MNTAIKAALIGAGVAIALAIGGYLVQSGRVDAHLDALEYREQRIEDKIDVIAGDVSELRAGYARLEERLRVRTDLSHSP